MMQRFSSVDELQREPGMANYPLHRTRCGGRSDASRLAVRAGERER